MGSANDVPFRIYVDNMAAIQQIAKGEHAAWRTRHISIRGVAVSDSVSHEESEAHYVGTADMAADGLTKALPLPTLMRMKELELPLLRAFV